jgi:hypothetical protein
LKRKAIFYQVDFYSRKNQFSRKMVTSSVNKR